MQLVYILESEKDGSHYVGTTTDLKKRLRDHNWHTVQSTKAKAPYKVVWFCKFQNKEKAFSFEKYLKTGSGIAFYRKRLI